MKERFCEGRLYFKEGLDESTEGGTALKLIFTASRKTGLKVEVISIVLRFELSCAEAPTENKKLNATIKIDKMNGCVFNICFV